MTKELLSQIVDIFKLKEEYYVSFESGWISPSTGEWFFLSIRGCLFVDWIDQLRELVYVSNISVKNGQVVITCCVR